MGRAHATGSTALRAIATLALLLSVFPTAQAVAAPGVTAAETAHDEAVVQLMILERRVADAERQVAGAEKRLNTLEAEVEEALGQAERAAADLEDARSRYSRRMIEAYKAGGTGWLGLLLDSDSLSQFIGRTLMLGRILDQDASLAERIAVAQREAEGASKRAQEAVSTQEEELTRLRATQDSLEESKKEQAALVAALGQRLEEAKAAAAAAECKMAEANARAKQSQGNSATTSVSARPTTTQPVVSTPVPGGRQLRVKAWAYALTGTTATGIPVARGVVAVDPRVIPLGTRLYIPGYGEGIAADTGRDIKGNIIDLWMASLSEARAWGTRYVTITIYD